MKRRLIAEQWEGFAKRVLPKDASGVQRTETRRAFYAGAWGFFAATLRGLDPDQDPTQADVDLLNGAVEEMEEFFEDVLKGRA